MFERKDLESIPGVEVVGGNYIAGEAQERVVLARVEDGTLVITPEGEAAIKANLEKKPAKKAAKPAAEEVDVLAGMNLS